MGLMKINGQFSYDRGQQRHLEYYTGTVRTI